jgi:putative endonuclease
MMAIFVYMLRCRDGSFYVGSTRASLERRIGEHNAGTFGGYTARRRPVRLVWHQEFQRITDAIAVERQLKGWRRAKKEALARGDWDSIRALGARRAGRPQGSAPHPSRLAALAPQDED